MRCSRCSSARSGGNEARRAAHHRPRASQQLRRSGDPRRSEPHRVSRRDPRCGRRLALDPELLFLDEPTAGLDPIAAAAFDELIRGLQKRLDLTVFLITHDLDTLYAICDRVAVIADRKVIAVGTIRELLALDHPWIQEYFDGPRGGTACRSHEEPRAARW